jgi:hypothetical protein
MNLSNNFNYSGLKSQIDIGEIVVDFGYKYEPEQVKYIQMVDNFETWRTVPKKTMPNPVGSGFVTVVPNTTKPITNGNSYFQRRQLHINPIGGGDENVALPAVTGKKWYLDSVSFRAYDMHEYLPEWLPEAIKEDMGTTDINDLYIADAFGEDINGVVVGWNINDEITWANSPYTTNSYPDFQFDNTDKKYSESGSAFPFIGAGKYGQNWETFDTMNQSGSRSGFVGGMLSSDWFPNNFSFNISGSNSATGIITGVSDMVFGSDQNTTYRNGTGNWSHTALPLQLSNMNIEINYPYLGVEVYGAGYNHYLYWNIPSGQDQTIKGLPLTVVVPRTIVQFPIICELIVVQR